MTRVQHVTQIHGVVNVGELNVDTTFDADAVLQAEAVISSSDAVGSTTVDATVKTITLTSAFKITKIVYEHKRDPAGDGGVTKLYEIVAGTANLLSSWTHGVGEGTEYVTRTYTMENFRGKPDQFRIDVQAAGGGVVHSVKNFRIHGRIVGV